MYTKPGKTRESNVRYSAVPLLLENQNDSLEVSDQESWMNPSLGAQGEWYYLLN